MVNTSPGESGSIAFYNPALIKGDWVIVKIDTTGATGPTGPQGPTGPSATPCDLAGNHAALEAINQAGVSNTTYSHLAEAYGVISALDEGIVTLTYETESGVTYYKVLICGISFILYLDPDGIVRPVCSPTPSLCPCDEAMHGVLAEIGLNATILYIGKSNYYISGTIILLCEDTVWLQDTSEPSLNYVVPLTSISYVQLFPVS